jgi:hypothetical protein
MGLFGPRAGLQHAILIRLVLTARFTLNPLMLNGTLTLHPLMLSLSKHSATILRQAQDERGWDAVQSKSRLS